MAIKVSGTNIMSNARKLQNVASMSQSTRYAFWGNRGLQQGLVWDDGTGRTHHFYDVNYTRNTESWYNVLAYATPATGTVKFRLSLLTQNASFPGSYRIRRKRNGVISTVASGSVTSTTASNKNHNIAVVAGDMYDIGIFGNSVTSGKTTTNYTTTLNSVTFMGTSASPFYPVTPTAVGSGLI